MAEPHCPLCTVYCQTGVCWLLQPASSGRSTNCSFFGLVHHGCTDERHLLEEIKSFPCQKLSRTQWYQKETSARNLFLTSNRRLITLSVFKALHIVWNCSQHVDTCSLCFVRRYFRKLECGRESSCIVNLIPQKQTQWLWNTKKVTERWFTG